MLFKIPYQYLWCRFPVVCLIRLLYDKGNINLHTLSYCLNVIQFDTLETCIKKYTIRTSSCNVR